MMILISGQPGNGKSLRAMALVAEEYERNAAGVKAGKEQPRRFFTNIAGATAEENPDAFPWMEKLPDHNDWRELPDGSYVIYDEAHADGRTVGLERYGVLFPGTGKPGESDDPRIRAMSTHRHRGFDLVFVTQWPSKVHHNLRQLVGKHIHMNRAMGLQRAGVLTWSRVQSDPYDESQREKAEEEIWAFDKTLYSRYRSSTLHTATYKFRVPKKVWGALCSVVMMVLVGWALWAFLFKPADAKWGDTSEGAPAVALAPLGAGGPAPVSDGDYLGRMQPRIPGAPWSAPLYDQTNKPADPPRVYCMIGDTCRCITDQGTRYKMDPVKPARDQALCRSFVENGGILDPFRRREESREGGVGGEPPSSAASMDAHASAPLPGAVISADQVSAYGDFGVGQGAAPR